MTAPGDFKQQQFEPLITDSGQAPTGKKPKRPKNERPPKQSASQRWKAFVASQTDTPERAKRFKAVGFSAAALALVAVGLGLYFTLRPYPMPDYEDDPLDEIFNYTLFQNEFNNLPVEERVRLVGSLIQRVEGMGGSDGTLLAAFAAGITGSAREQLEENAAQMMLDFMDKFAHDYPSLDDPEAQEEALKSRIADMIRLAEEFDGRPTNRTDEELLERAMRDARRDQEVMRDPTRGPSLGGISRMADMMENRIGERGTPHQRARITRYMRDMTRYLRGEDLVTGKPKGGG